MGILYAFGILYTIVGFLYAAYILLFGWDPWYKFPINWALGPIGLIITYLAEAKKRNTKKI